MTAEEILFRFFTRKRDTHKGLCGKVCVLAGCFEMTGAALLCAEAALRTGAGLVYMAAPRGLIPVFETVLREAVFCPLGDKGDTFYKPEHLEDALKAAGNCDSVIIGPGMGRRKETAEFVCRFLSEYRGKILVDADALYALSSRDSHEIKKVLYRENEKKRVVFTPHEGEAARLFNIKTGDISENRQKYCLQGAEDFGCVFVLKGQGTLVSDGGTIYENNTGNAGMATAGSGDVLSGIIGGLLVSEDAFEAAVGGTYLHGKTGDCCRNELGMSYMTSGDMVKYMYKAIKPYESETD